MDQSVFFIGPGFVYEFLSFVLSVVILILHVRIIIRVEKQLDTYFKVSALAFTFLFIRQLMVMGIRLDIFHEEAFVAIPSLLFASTIIVSLGIMGRLLSSMNRQK